MQLFFVISWSPNTPNTTEYTNFSFLSVKYNVNRKIESVNRIDRRSFQFADVWATCRIVFERWQVTQQLNVKLKQYPVSMHHDLHNKFYRLCL